MSRSELDLPTFPPGQFQAREMSDLYGFDDANSVWRRVAVDATGKLIVVGGGGGGGVGIVDTDDNSIVSGQTTLLAIDENYIHNGTSWIRWQGGVDNAVAPASPQGSFVGGIVTDPVGVFANGDVSLFHFDTSGRLLVAASFAAVTDTDDNAVAPGQAGLLLEISEGYVYNGTDWIRHQGGTDDTPAPATPQGAFTAGKVITSFPALALADVAVDRFTVDAAKLTIPRTQEPFELALSQAAIAASATFTSTSIQQNSLFAGSLGRTLLSGFVNYAGTASSLTIFVDVSLDSGVTYIPTDSFEVLSGTPTIIRNLSVALGNRVRIRVVNNDGANGSGTTNIGFYLTHAN